MKAKAEKYDRRADAKAAAGDYAAAGNLAVKAYEIDPSKARAYVAGTIFEIAGDVERAVVMYRKGLKSSEGPLPQDADATAYLAKHGKPEDAKYPATKSVLPKYTGTTKLNLPAAYAADKAKRTQIKESGKSLEEEVPQYSPKGRLKDPLEKVWNGFATRQQFIAELTKPLGADFDFDGILVEGLVKMGLETGEALPNIAARLTAIGVPAGKIRPRRPTPGHLPPRCMTRSPALLWLMRRRRRDATSFSSR